MYEKLKNDAAELLREMIRIPSLSFEEQGVCHHISSRLSDWGIQNRVERKNIIAVHSTFNPLKPVLALDAHIDTVPVNNGYTTDPFDPGNDSTVIRGLGSNDDGGSVVSMIAAFRHFCGETLPMNLVLVLSCEEERSGENGARWLYAEDGYFSTELKMPDYVIVGEPTSLKAATSERGLLVIDAVSEGVSGHAARGNGVNAIYKALEDIEKLRQHKFTKISPTMGAVRLNVTQIEAGTAHNVIPDKCKFVIDIRPTEKYTNPEILEELQAECSSTLTARNLTNRSSATFESSVLTEVLEELGIETFSSPTTSNWMRIPCDAIKIGPGESPRSHKADEFILTEEIDNAVDTYIRLIETMASKIQ